ncbi:MAG: metal-dependent hydrolase [Anaerobacillus sp.]|uniref:metal-dependent hydrolase n=1 Tax=Anaerobacillus sp. TaxID=1872506 RepID=UPI00391B639E
MKVTYHGHSVVLIESNGKSLIIDPFLTGNGQTKIKADELNVDYILLTHGHNDHVGDTVHLAKQNNATVIAPFELATYLSWQGVNTHAMHIGGAFQFDIGRVKLTQAIHGSAYVDEDAKKIVYTGMPAGILFTAEGKTIYHAGDTGLFSDMKLFGEREKIDVAFLPIGDNFTMGPNDAVVAASWLKAKVVIPIHYNTFPVIEQDPHAFVSMLSKETEGKVLGSGEVLEL